MNKIVLVASLIVTSMPGYAGIICYGNYCNGTTLMAGQCVQQNFAGATCDCSDVDKTGNPICNYHPDAGPCGNGATCTSSVTCDYSTCDTVTIPPPPPPTTPPPPSPPPPPACVPNGSCVGAIPSCGMTGPGLDNCGTACTIAGLPCPPPPAVIGTCGIGLICGTVKSPEGIALSGIRMLLRNVASAQVIKSVMTDDHGQYTMALPAGRYSIGPTIGRNQLASPASSNAIGTFDSDFSIAGVPGRVTMNGLTPGTFVLFSEQAYSAANPPSIHAGSNTHYAMTTVNSEGRVSIDLTSGTMYFVTCWKQTGHTFTKTQSAQIGENILAAQSNVIAQCQ